MGNIIECKGKFAFHPGYYINEAVEASQLTFKEFAERQDTTTENLKSLLCGEQRLSE